MPHRNRTRPISSPRLGIRDSQRPLSPLNEAWGASSFIIGFALGGCFHSRDLFGTASAQKSTAYAHPKITRRLERGLVQRSRFRTMHGRCLERGKMDSFLPGLGPCNVGFRAHTHTLSLSFALYLALPCTPYARVCVCACVTSRDVYASLVPFTQICSGDSRCYAISPFRG